mmetsp:Transcript_20603/g.59817  ORF Transcript_20603/g.59817 Transcript_20603/m.59817 type:complete len:104 (-) Transcript_20603:2556-2867(-)
MKLTVKTLKGGKFQVDAEPSKTVAEVKTIIVSIEPPSHRVRGFSGFIFYGDPTLLRHTHGSCGIENVGPTPSFHPKKPNEANGTSRTPPCDLDRRRKTMQTQN